MNARYRKNGCSRVLGRVLAEEVDGVLGDGGGGVVAVAGLDRRQLLVVEEVGLGREVAVPVLEPVRAIEPAGQRPCRRRATCRSDSCDSRPA